MEYVVNERCAALAAEAFSAAAYVDSEDFGERLAARRVIEACAVELVAAREALEV